MQYFPLTLRILCLGGTLSQWNFGGGNFGGGIFGGGNLGVGKFGGGNLGGGNFNNFFGGGLGGFLTPGGGLPGGSLGGEVGGDSAAAGGGDEFKREVLNPLGCPAEERSREGDKLLVTYKVSSRIS